MLARVTGYRAYVRCSLPTAGAASNLCLASRAAFPVAGVKADAGYGFLWPPLGRDRRRVAGAAKAALLAVCLDVQRSTTQLFRRDFADFEAVLLLLFAARVSPRSHRSDSSAQ